MIDLRALLAQAARQFDQQLPKLLDGDAVCLEVFDFMMERLKAYYADKGVAPQVLEAVMARQPATPLDFDRRVTAVGAFLALPQAPGLSAANKRIRNILKKSQSGQAGDLAAVDTALLQTAQERALFGSINTHQAEVAPLLEAADYTGALTVLAGLRDAVDAFFDTVMVMVEDAAVRANRLALLQALAQLLGHVADISRLDGV